MNRIIMAVVLGLMAVSASADSKWWLSKSTDGETVLHYHRDGADILGVHCVPLDYRMVRLGLAVSSENVDGHYPVILVDMPVSSTYIPNIGWDYSDSNSSAFIDGLSLDDVKEHFLDEIHNRGIMRIEITSSNYKGESVSKIILVDNYKLRPFADDFMKACDQAMDAPA